MTDDRFEEMLRDAARGYNEPPPTPREEMWERIANARRASRDAEPSTGPRTVSLLRRPHWWMGLAAALLIGVAIGRSAMMTGGTGPLHGVQPTGEAVANQTPVDPVPQPGAQAQAPAQGREVRDGGSQVARVDPTRGAARSRAGQAGATAPATEREQPVPPADVQGLYRHAAQETLGQAEALLTLFRAEQRPEARMRVATWARDVLSSTRMLLDSPAADDPELAVLLSDLELVLAQISALGGDAGDEQERELIDDAIRQRDVIPRLRTVIPAGPRSAGA